MKISIPRLNCIPPSLLWGAFLLLSLVLQILGAFQWAICLLSLFLFAILSYFFLMNRLRSKERQIAEERQEKKAFLDALGEGVIVVDGRMGIQYVNANACKMLGIPKRHLLGRLFPLSQGKSLPSLLEKCAQLLQNCQKHQEILTDSIFLEEEGKLYLDLLASPRRGGRGAALILQDKSSHYRVLEMGKDFVANASHELRTPITIIRGFAETLQDLPELSSEMLSDITDKIVRNCQRMDNLVKNLLTLADIENLPESRFQECDLVGLVEECRHELLCVYPESHVEIKKNRDQITLAADHEILELAISNLLDNAAKYSSGPPMIVISLELLEKEVKISICDQGMGIPLADLEHIFERFYTVNKAHSRRLGGAGLGLSIVKTIIEKHEGSIRVESTLGKGTRFTLLLPIHRGCE